jgi:ribosomal protein S18 acetylase RimI-like enzyme
MNPTLSRLVLSRATLLHAERIARLFAAAFARDPVLDWLMRAGDTRPLSLQRFFVSILYSRTIPHGETWMTDDGLGVAAWIPPHCLAAQPNLTHDLRMLPAILRLMGVPRLSRGSALAAAMERVQPAEPYHYLAFLGVAPRVQGSGLGSALLARTLDRVDAVQGNAYLESSNPRNLRLYERAGFSVIREIRARSDAPPIFALWRSKKAQGSSTISQ